MKPTIPEPPTPDADGVVRVDVAIVGAGVAGLAAALALPGELSVCIMDKGRTTTSGSSPWAQGGMAVALGSDDSPARHATDTMRAGDGLCLSDAVGTLTAEAPARTRALIELGAAFDTVDGATSTPDTELGALALAREGGQSVARSVHRADATGAELVRVLRGAAAPRVSRLVATATRLLVTEAGRVAGLTGLAGPLNESGEPVTVHAGAVVLATGGAGGLFAATTNDPNSTADGVALALDAGAALRDMEFIQFHPTGIVGPDARRWLLTEALRGEGARIVTRTGTPIMAGVHPDEDLAPRHIVASRIIDVDEPVFLDARPIGANALRTHFPTAVKGATALGYDITSEPVPVTPAAHYMVGGVETDLDGRSTVPGLWAAGEVASTGVHGANRMAGNSLTEALVFGHRAGIAIGDDLHSSVEAAPMSALPTLTNPLRKTAPAALGGAVAANVDALQAELQTIMWDFAGPVRNEAGLRKGVTALHDLDSRALGDTARHHQLRLGIVASETILRAALHRTESRGGHVRTDAPSSATTHDAAEREEAAMHSRLLRNASGDLTVTWSPLQD